MWISFVNLAMLAGLLTVALPVLVHLLSKRRYDVVQWGAMQFLQLGQRTRRRIRLQDLLLLLLRMGLLACLVFALARPYGQGAFFARIGKSVSRDVVFILDGSGSMGWKGDAQTPHAHGLQWIHRALEDLNPGDTVSLIDARARNRRLISPPTTNMSLVRRELDQIPAPTGISHLTEAILDALRILATTSNVTREVIVLTDNQALPWQLDGEFGLLRIDDALSQTEVKPSIALVNLAQEKQNRTNLSVDRIELSRDITVPGFPIRFQSTIRQSGGVARQVEVSLAINGQPAPESQRLVNLLPDGEALVDFEHLFPANGHYRITLTLPEDDLPQDDRAEAIVVVEDGVPVLLIDGAPHLDVTQSETFFLQSAFGASGEESRWVRSDVGKIQDLTLSRLSRYRVVFLCNVATLSEQQFADLLAYLDGGGGVVIAPGSEVRSDHWNGLEVAGQPFLPARLKSIARESPRDGELITIESLSLEHPWLQRFRKESGVDFWLSRFSSWWELEPYTVAEQLPEADAPPQANLLSPSDSSDPDSEESQANEVNSVLARLTNGAPWLVSRSLGEGTLILLASPLDADWSTLPARSDFVPFVHELVFRLARLQTQHNLEIGMPIRIPLADDERPRDFVVTGPGVTQGVPESVRVGRRTFGTFGETTIPGLYTVRKVSEPRSAGIPFIVNDDPRESDLTPLDELAWETLTQQGRLTAISSMQELTNRVQTDHSRTELWWLLLLMLLLMLVSEVALTRKMVREGHAEFGEEGV